MADETTPLATPLTKLIYDKWLQSQGNPGTYKYDMQGFFQSGQPHKPGDHFPDTYKQHGHPTFSQESQYSKGPSDGGMWLGDNYLAQPPMAASHPLVQQLLLRQGQ